MSGKQAEKSGQGSVFKIFVVCVFSGTCNIVLNYTINGLAGLPVYLDTVFTAAVCFSAGLAPSLFAGLLFPALLTPVKYVYLLNQPVEAGLVVYFFYICILAQIILICFFHKKMKPAELVFLDSLAAKKPSLRSFIPLAVQLLTLAALACVIVSILGGIIGYTVGLFSMPRSVYPEDTFLFGLLRNNVPQLASEILSRLPINIVDRFIVIFAGYGISLLYRKWLGSL